MQIENYLQNYQPVIYRTFLNALNKQKLSHAYLLSGEQGMPLKDSAIFLAKSLLCDNPSPLACNKCMTCIRIDEGNYADILVFGEEGSKIKKEAVNKILDTFDKTSLEDKGIMIYVLHRIETMTAKAVNSLLKFLEEPGKNVYAFLTTENETKILPTIISRTQVLRFRQIDRCKIIKDALSIETPQEDAEILSGIFSDPENIKEVAESKEYLSAKELVLELFKSINESNNNAIFTTQNLIIPSIKQNKNLRLYIKILAEFFKDLVSLTVNEAITLKSYVNILREVLPNLSHVSKTLTAILSAERKLDFNVNEALLLDHLTYMIVKEGK